MSSNGTDGSRERVIAVFPGHYVEKEKLASYKTWPARFVFTDRRIAIIDLNITGLSAMMNKVRSQFKNAPLYIEGDPPFGDPSYAEMDVSREMAAGERSLSIPRSSIKSVEEGNLDKIAFFNIRIFFDQDSKNPDHILVFPYNRQGLPSWTLHKNAMTFQMFLDQYFND